MKKLLGVILAMFFCSNVFSQGIEFEHGTFAEALAKAKKENKMVFMDCYTTTCGPCKKLAKNVFSQKEVGDYFNAHFVNVKMDMRTEEGIEIGKKYGVKSYPTLFFMGANGKVFHTKRGFSPATVIMEEAKIARDPSRRIGSLEEKYAEGNRDPKFVARYLTALHRAYKKDEIILVGKDFIANCSKEKLANADIFTVIASSGALEFGSETCKYIIANKDKFIATKGIGQENYDDVIGVAVDKYVDGVASNGTIGELKSAIKATKKHFTIPQQKIKESKWYSTYYWIHKEYEKWFDKRIVVAKETLKTDKKTGDDMMLKILEKLVWHRDFFKDTGVYEKAIVETENYLKDNNEMLKVYYYLACLYKENGNKTKALENINTFITRNTAVSGKNNARIIRLKKNIEKM